MTGNKTVHLVYVNAEKNNNKYYTMRDNGDGSWTAIYGRVGYGKGRTMQYPMSVWERKRNEKIAKGYKDPTYLYNSSTTADELELQVEPKPIKEKQVGLLIDYLIQCARHTIEQNYTISINQVSGSMIEDAKKLLVKLEDCPSKAEFNYVLMDLFYSLPRRMNKVSDYLAEDESQFTKIISREFNLLQMMESMMKQESNKRILSNKRMQDTDTILDKLGLEIFEATDEQVKFVMKHLGERLKNKVINIYRVINRGTRQKFEDYLKKNGQPEVKMLWHGSLNENWMSILEKGLLIKPVAKTNGSMFGKGIYFAPSPSKSWGYTSSSDAVYTHESQNKAFMGLFAVATGKQKDLYSWNSTYSSLTSATFKKSYPDYDSFYAHGSTTMLKNDEIILFREDQMTMDYLVEFRG